MKNLDLNILSKLISYKSITPSSSGSIEYITDLLNSLGFKCDIQFFGKGKSETTNLYARYGSSSPNICFAGHVDVVPPMNEALWHYDPFKMTIEGEKIYGRGIVDMKGAIACFLSATLHYLDNNSPPKGSISFLLTSDEEGEAKYGTKMMLKYLAKQKEKIDFTILGEPTSQSKIGDLLKIGRRGSINFALILKGKQGHVAYPNKALNPISTMIKIANDLESFNFDHGSDFFDKTNLEITSIDVGNKVSNIIPENIAMKFNVRFNDLHNAKSLVSKITNLISKYDIYFDLKYHSSAESFCQKYSSNMAKFANIVEKQCRIKPKIDTSGGTSDARFIHKYNDVLELGLLSDQAHKINEHAKISDLQILYNVYYDALVDFLN